MEEARANQARRLARLQAQQTQPQPEPEPQPRPATITDVPHNLLRDIMMDALTEPRGEHWEIPFLRDTAQLATVNRDFRDEARGISNLFPIYRSFLGQHYRPRALAAIQRAQHTRLRRAHLADDEGDPWMPLRLTGPNPYMARDERLVDRRGNEIDRGRD